MYEPGKVPKWLDEQRDATSAGGGGGGSAAGGTAPSHEDSAEDAKFAGHRHGRAEFEDALEKGTSHPSGRWIMYGILGVWGAFIAIAAFFVLRRFGMCGSKPRRHRSRFD